MEQIYYIDCDLPLHALKEFFFVILVVIILCFMFCEKRNNLKYDEHLLVFIQ